MSDCEKRGVHPHPLTSEEMAAQVDELLRHQLHTSSPCGPRATLVDQSSENVSASDVVKVGDGPGRRFAEVWWSLVEGAMRTMRVVVVDVDR